MDHPDEHTKAIARLEVARAVFPIDRRFRQGPAVYLSLHRWKGSRPLAIKTLREALATDQYSFDLRRNLAGFLFEDGDTPGAIDEISAIKRYQPGRDIPVIVNVNPATN